MISVRSILWILPALGVLATLAGCERLPDGPAETEHAAAQSGELERGPHGGRMMRAGELALELQIFEEGVPPEFHAYLFKGGKPLPPTAAQVVVSLARLDGEVNRFTFAPQADFLRGSGVVHEPHSFRVTVEASEGGRTHRWTFDSFEGRTTIAAAIAAASGIRTEIAGSASISDSLALTGRLVPNPERMRAVTARFPGPIRNVSRSLGASVKAGERLATVESNESLETYPVNAPIDGIVIERHANAGETAGTEPLFVIADYRSLWAELSVFPRDLARVKAGQSVQLTALEGRIEGQGTIARIAPVEAAEHGVPSGVYTARVAVDNTDGRWSPGLFVEGRVRIGEAQVSLAAKRSALQSFRDFTVVFVQVGETYEARVLELGRQDDTWAEVLSGLRPGSAYVTENSYLIKADIEKSGASHDH